MSTRRGLVDTRLLDDLCGFNAHLMLVNTNTRTHRRRFYWIAWQPTLPGEWALVRQWGVWAAPGASRSPTPATREAAAREIRRLLRTRLRHGYRVSARA
jgi:predicted DNA-binding WGR domain protein